MKGLTTPSGFILSMMSIQDQQAARKYLLPEKRCQIIVHNRSRPGERMHNDNAQSGLCDSRQNHNSRYNVWRRWNVDHSDLPHVRYTSRNTVMIKEPASSLEIEALESSSVHIAHIVCSANNINFSCLRLSSLKAFLLLKCAMWNHLTNNGQ